MKIELCMHMLSLLSLTNFSLLKIELWMHMLCLLSLTDAVAFQKEYIRGISGWNFNLEDLKNAAALVRIQFGVPDSTSY